MKHREKYVDYLFNIITVWLFSFSVISAVISLTILEAGLIHIFMLSGLFTILYFVVFFNEYTLTATGAVLVLVGLYIFWVFSREAISAERLEFARHLHGTWLFITGINEFSAAFNQTTLNLIIGTVTLICSALMRFKHTFPLIFCIGAGVFIAANISAPQGYYPTFFIMLAVLLVLYVKKTKNSTATTLRLLPVCLAAMGISFILPMPDAKLSRETLEQAYEDVYWFFREPFMPKYFTSGFTGFESGGGKLGGNMRFNNNFIMYVFADEPMYLTGASSDIYTGASWQSSAGDLEFLPAQSLDTAQSQEIFTKIYADFGTFLDTGSRGIESRQVTINIGKARTGTLFRPERRYDTNIYGEYSVMARGDDLRTDPVLKKDAIYTMDYYHMDYDNDFIQGILKESRRGYYADESLRLMNEIVQNPSMIYLRQLRYIQAAYLYETLYAPAALHIYENYTGLPEDIPGRVFQLAHDITMNCESDYEKAKAIESYLSHMTYTLTPGVVPEDRDFVDYFLFDGRQGYCTYYATAMAVLARAVGLPSRYNEGYILPEEKTGGGYYEVYGVNAHAWADVYFEGVGWIPFEATPASYFEEYYPSYASSTGNDYFSDDISEEYFYDDSLGLLGSDDGEIDMLYTGAAPAGEEKTPVKPAPVVLLSLAVGLISYMFIKKAAENKRHREMRSGDSPRQAAITAYKGLVDLLSFSGLPMEPYESALAYSARIGPYSPLGPLSTNTAAEVFSKARYSTDPISDGEASILRRAYFSVYRQLQNGSHKFKFFIHRYLFNTNRLK